MRDTDRWLQGYSIFPSPVHPHLTSQIPALLKRILLKPLLSVPFLSLVGALPIAFTCCQFRGLSCRFFCIDGSSYSFRIRVAGSKTLLM